MGEDLLADVLQRVEASAPEVRAPALMRISRVQAVLDPPAARPTFERGLAEARRLTVRDPWLLFSSARLLAGVVAPDLLASIPESDRARHHFESDRMARTMMEHGYVDRAVDYVLGCPETPEFPFGMVGALLHRMNDAERKLQLMRRTVQAWRKEPDEHSPFLWTFQSNWTDLPPEEALEIVREIVGLTLERPEFNGSGTYDAEGTVQIHSGRENNLFQLLHVLRRLDPTLAGQLIAGHSQLAAAAQRFPNGMESVREEAEARSRQAAGPACEGGFLMCGSPDEFGYLRSLMQASKDGNFAPTLAHALEHYHRDSAAGDPNQALREFWPSTCTYRMILYRAGQRLGTGAIPLLETIPDPDLRLFAQIELAASLAGLPELPGVQSEARLPRRKSFAAAGSRQTETVGGLQEADAGAAEPRIRCPKCQWRPQAHDRWQCHCSHVWNTFDTGGVCPACMYQWKVTQCLDCGEMSPHSDWYTHPQ